MENIITPGKPFNIIDLYLLLKTPTVYLATIIDVHNWDEGINNRVQSRVGNNQVTIVTCQCSILINFTRINLAKTSRPHKIKRPLSF